MTKHSQRTRDYEALGRQIESMYDAVNPDRHALYRTAFLKGVVAGVGGVIGATLVVALLIWLLSLFGQVPFIGHFVETIRHTLQQHEQ